MWFFEIGITHLLGKKYQNRYWGGSFKIWYTFSRSAPVSLVIPYPYPYSFFFLRNRPRRMRDPIPIPIPPTYNCLLYMLCYIIAPFHTALLLNILMVVWWFYIGNLLHHQFLIYRWPTSLTAHPHYYYY